MIIEEIKNNLNKYASEIIKTLLSDNGKHFKQYFLIRRKFLKNEIDEQFKSVFCGFYIMNGARGLNNLQKNKFFKLLSLKEDNLEKILKSLYKIIGHGSSRKLFLSFGTKLIHTINENLPIYDGNIANILELPMPTQTGTLEEKIKNRIDVYQELQNNFKLLLKDKIIIDYLRDARKVLSVAAKINEFEWKNSYISNTKLLDSLLWALYPTAKKEVDYVKNNFPKLTKEESSFFKRLSKTGVLVKFNRMGSPLQRRIALSLVVMAGSKINPYNDYYAGRINKKEAIKHYLKACEYWSDLIHRNDDLRDGLGLPIIKKHKK